MESAESHTLSAIQLAISLTPTASRLFHYLQYEDVDSLYDICALHALEVGRIMDTLCGASTNVLSYLLSFTQDGNSNFKAYTITLTGYLSTGEESKTGHKFLYFPTLNIIVDSYFNQRTPSYRTQSLSKLMELITSIEQRFDNETYQALTLSLPSDEQTVRMTVDMAEYIFNPNAVREKFNALVNLSLQHLDTDMGISDEYLFLLNSDVAQAEAWLKSLIL